MKTVATGRNCSIILNTETKKIPDIDVSLLDVLATLNKK